MILTKTPLRISFFGGGTDLEQYYANHEGKVLSCTINKYVYVAINRKFDSGIRVAYSKTENVEHIDEIEHPIVREALKIFNVNSHIEVVSLADIPASGSGLGSSSAFTVGLVKGLSSFTRESISKSELASIACEIEIHKLQEPIGKQDQYAVSTGGLNRFHFRKDGKVISERIGVPQDILLELKKHLLLFYTGISRQATGLLREQARLTSSNLSVINNLHHMKSFVDRGVELIESGRVRELGSLLGESWDLKKSLNSSVTNDDFDINYDLAISEGAWGGKLLGAGGGGFFLFIADPKNHDNIERKVNGWRRVPIKFEYLGSQVQEF